HLRARARRRRALLPGGAGRGRRRDDRARAGADRHPVARPADGDARGALPRPHRARGRRRGGRVTAVYRWEVAKLLAQKRTYLGLGAAMLVPLVFVLVLVFKAGGP